MRAVYLVRHGEVENGIKKSCCLGRTDLPLSRNGRKQARQLGEWFARHPVERIISSPLCRCLQTGEEIAVRCGPMEVDENLIEMDAGQWENMEFEEIRRKFPRAYEERGRCLGLIPPPGGESFYQGGIRLYGAIRQWLQDTEGDLVFVSHSGVIRGLVCMMMGGDPARIMDIPQPAGGITKVWAGENGELLVNGLDVGIRPAPFPDREERIRLEAREDIPDAVLRHEAAVAQLAYGWAAELKRQGREIDPELTRCGGLLHDIARCKPDHGEEGGKILRREGYPLLAHIIRSHHCLTHGEEYRFTEAALVFLADKRIFGEQEVPLRERFERSAEKCRTPEARFSHQLQYRQAVTIQRNLGMLVNGLEEEALWFTAGG